MALKPKERVIYDADAFAGADGIDLAAADLMTRDGITADTVRERYTDEELSAHAAEMQEWAYDDEMTGLLAYFGGSPSHVTEAVSENGGNPLLLSGYDFDGKQWVSAFKDFNELMGGYPFGETGISRVWDENGRLFLQAGINGDYRALVGELRQLTAAGKKAYETFNDLLNGVPVEADFIETPRGIWADPNLCPPPRYMERAYGLPAMEYSLEQTSVPLPLGRIGFEDEICENDGKLNFYIPVTFDVDSVFGTDVCSLGNDDWLNIYADYDMEAGEAADHLDISLNRADGSIEYLTYPLDAAQREILRGKMDAYCLRETGMGLDAYVQSLADEEPQSPSLAQAAREGRASSAALAADEPADARDAQER